MFPGEIRYFPLRYFLVSIKQAAQNKPCSFTSYIFCGKLTSRNIYLSKYRFHKTLEDLKLGNKLPKQITVIKVDYVYEIYDMGK